MKHNKVKWQDEAIEERARQRMSEIMEVRGATAYKIKGYPNSEIIFDYDEEVFHVFKDGVEVATCLTASDAKAIVKTSQINGKDV